MADYRLTDTDTVIRVSDSAHIPNDPANRDRREYDAWLEGGGVPDPYVVSQEQQLEAFRAAIQSHIDETARSRSYDSGNSLASYVASTNETWAAEAGAFVAWRDAVWVYAYAELDKVTSGQRPVPTVEDFIAELPVMVWPA